MHGAKNAADGLIGNPVALRDLAEGLALFDATEDLGPVFGGNTSTRFLRPGTTLFVCREDGERWCIGAAYGSMA